jgi:hypothetical protein
MALATVRKSDKSGELIPEGTGARVRIMFYDESRADRRADLTDEEIEKILGFAQEVVTRPERRAKRLSV